MDSHVKAPDIIDVINAVRNEFLRRGVEVYPQGAKLWDLAHIWGIQSLIDLAEFCQKHQYKLSNDLLRDWYMGRKTANGKIEYYSPGRIPLEAPMSDEQIMEILGSNRGKTNSEIKQ